MMLGNQHDLLLRVGRYLDEAEDEAAMESSNELRGDNTDGFYRYREQPVQRR
jgi:hypothetical protein